MKHATFFVIFALWASAALGQQRAVKVDNTGAVILDTVGSLQTSELPAFRAGIGLEIGDAVQEYDPQLDAVSGNARHVFLPAWQFAPRATAGAAASVEEYATNDINLDQYLFAGDATEGVQVVWQVPWDYDQGTVKVKIYWDAASGASAADLVSFDVRAGSLANDDAIDTALGSAVEVDDVVIAVGDLHVSPASAAMTIAGTPAAGDLIIIQVERDHDDAADDMTEDLKFLGMAIEYTARTSALTPW